MKNTNKQTQTVILDEDYLVQIYQLTIRQINEWQDFIITILDSNSEQLIKLQMLYPEKFKKIEDCGGLQIVLERTSKERGTEDASLYMMLNLLDYSNAA